MLLGSERKLVMLSATGLSPSRVQHSLLLRLAARHLYSSPTTPFSRFRLLPFRSPLLRESLLLSFPLATKMFQFPRFPPHRLWVQRWVTTHSVVGFSHSGICGSTPVCGSSQLIAADHALHRLLAPRHPPCALSSLPSLARFSMTPVQLSKWKSLGPLPVVLVPSAQP